jgi:glucokinase
MVYIGIDLGGTNIAAGIVNEEGKILVKESIPTGATRGYEEIVADMAHLSLSLLEKIGMTIDDVSSVGIGSPGSVDHKNGILIYSNNLTFRFAPLRTEMQKYINKNVYLENDANCATIAESIAGAGKGISDMVAITLGTGVGGGIIINQRIYRGFNGAGGELGHIVTHSKGVKCTCGRLGCFEAYASATALIRRTREEMSIHPESMITELCGGNPDKINAKTTFDAMHAGDPVGVALVDEFINELAEGISNIINTFMPEVLIIGGGVSKEGDTLLAPLRKLVTERTYGPEGVMKTRIEVAKMGNDAGIVGAAFICKVD